MIKIEAFGCDLLENSYLCGISNNVGFNDPHPAFVVICLKIRTFVVSATTVLRFWIINYTLWFAWKFVPLWYQQQHFTIFKFTYYCCDLLENSYLCGISNNGRPMEWHGAAVVICLKIRTFVVSATTYYNKRFIYIKLWFAWKFVPLWYQQQRIDSINYTYFCCDLLENSYLCGISNNVSIIHDLRRVVVICLKIRTFVVSATTILRCITNDF